MTKKRSLLPILILLITLISVNQFSSVPIGNTYFEIILSFITVVYVFWYKKKYFHPYNRKDYRIVSIYLIWLLIGIIRGCFVAENYWEWKQLIQGSFSLSLPIFVYVFSDPGLLQSVLRTWFKYAIPLFFLFFMWVVIPGAYHFYLGPLFLIACFLPILPWKWKYLCLILLIVMLFIAFGARSQVIKSAIALLMSLAYLLSKYISNSILKITHWVCYLLPIILLVLGISGTFNIFRGMAQNEGKYVEKRVINGTIVNEDLSDDTRTFIYEEVITSAIRHNYAFFGRTPARGNDSAWFGAYNAEELNTGKYERHSNEVCHPNVFTWLGLVGMFMYSFLYLKSSYLAVYRSNNLFMKLLGVFIAFRWAYGWVEDFNTFQIMSISIWMMIAMGFSASFRQMDNNTFKKWIRNIFN